MEHKRDNNDILAKAAKLEEIKETANDKTRCDKEEKIRFEQNST